MTSLSAWDDVMVCVRWRYGLREMTWWSARGDVMVYIWSRVLACLRASRDVPPACVTWWPARGHVMRCLHGSRARCRARSVESVTQHRLFPLFVLPSLNHSRRSSANLSVRLSAHRLRFANRRSAPIDPDTTGVWRPVWRPTPARLWRPVVRPTPARVWRPVWRPTPVRVCSLPDHLAVHLSLPRQSQTAYSHAQLLHNNTISFHSHPTSNPHFYPTNIFIPINISIPYTSLGLLPPEF